MRDLSPALAQACCARKAFFLLLLLLICKDVFSFWGRTDGAGNRKGGDE